MEVTGIDISGKIVFSNTYKLSDAQQSAIVIDGLSSLPKGIYVLRISSASEVFNKKITIY